LNLKISTEVLDNTPVISTIMARYLAVKVTEQSAWVALVARFLKSYIGCGGNLGSLKDALKTLESDFKDQNNIAQMPSTYRSAKSVILNALKNDVELLDSEGKPRGKTEVEKDIKTRNSYNRITTMPLHPVVPTINVDTDIKAIQCAGEIVSLWHSLEPGTRDVIRSHLQAYFINNP
jgi:hypothetical protein